MNQSAFQKLRQEKILSPSQKRRKDLAKYLKKLIKESEKPKGE